ncbi:hypothetical protein [Miniphocaeibacter massiliensis]|uniref:hypothetical protein n=1 Tax=Miniphocaeibacter massiliensis TaxID=2041841 RepID=UPI000C1BD172|nr:hypothetical protein [Miniphocaeibacter massiliensis]
MFNYLKAEIYRIFKKRSFYILMILAAVSYIAINFIMNNDGYNAETLMMTTGVLVQLGTIILGIFIFTTVYNDDFNSKSMQAIIGYGIKRNKLVIFKIITTAIMSVIVFTLLSIIFFVNLKLLNMSLSSDNLRAIASLVTSNIVKILVISAIAGIFSFFYQKAVPGTIVFVLAISQVLDMFLSTILGLNSVISLIGDRRELVLGSVLSNFEEIIYTGNIEIIPIAAIIIYFLGAILITMFTFKNRELEF